MYMGPKVLCANVSNMCKECQVDLECSDFSALWVASLFWKSKLITKTLVEFICNDMYVHKDSDMMMSEMIRHNTIWYDFILLLCRVLSAKATDYRWRAILFDDTSRTGW